MGVRPTMLPNVTDQGPSTWATSANPVRQRRCWPSQSEPATGLRLRKMVSMAADRVVYRRSAEFLGESDEKPFRPADVAEPIRIFIPDYFSYELRAALAEPFKRLIDVVHGKHDAEVA